MHQAHSSDLTLLVYEGSQGLQSIYDDWLALMRNVRNRCFYHHPHWFDAFLNRKKEANDKLCFFCIYRDSRLVAVFPIARRTAGPAGFAEISLPTNDSLLYMTDCAIADSENKREIYEFFRTSTDRATGRHWDVFIAPETLQDSNLSHCLSSAQSFWLVAERRKKCAVIDVVPYETALRNLTTKFRGNLNNAKRRLEKSGAEFVVVREPSDIAWAFREFVDLEKAGWKGNRKRIKKGYPPPSAIALFDSKLRFFEYAVNRFCDNGCIEITLLRIAGRTIGAQICILLDDVSYFMKGAYDESHKGYSTGHMLIDFAYQRYANEGRIKRINLISDYPWFRVWNPTKVDYVHYRHYNTTPKGLIGCLFYRCRRQLRQLRTTVKSRVQPPFS